MTIHDLLLPEILPNFSNPDHKFGIFAKFRMPTCKKITILVSLEQVNQQFLVHAFRIFWRKIQMFSTGLKLMIVGMLTVFLFLLLMIAFIKLIEILNRSHTQQEAERQRRPTKKPTPQEPHVPTVVLAAAIAAYEAERQQLINT